MLGYKPFFREYTTDWDYAVAKMRGSYFQRHLVEDSFAVAKAWPEQVKLAKGGKPGNAEYEQWTCQLHRDEKQVNGVAHDYGIVKEPKRVVDGNGAGISDEGFRLRR